MAKLSFIFSLYNFKARFNASHGIGANLTGLVPATQKAIERMVERYFSSYKRSYALEYCLQVQLWINSLLFLVFTILLPVLMLHIRNWSPYLSGIWPAKKK